MTRSLYLVQCSGQMSPRKSNSKKPMNYKNYTCLCTFFLTTRDNCRSQPQWARQDSTATFIHFAGPPRPHLKSEKSGLSPAMISFGHPVLRTLTFVTTVALDIEAVDPDFLKSTPAAGCIRYSAFQRSKVQKYILWRDWEKLDEHKWVEEYPFSRKLRYCMNLRSLLSSQNSGGIDPDRDVCDTSKWPGKVEQG